MRIKDSWCSCHNCSVRWRSPSSARLLGDAGEGLGGVSKGTEGVAAGGDEGTCENPGNIAEPVIIVMTETLAKRARKATTVIRTKKWRSFGYPTLLFEENMALIR